MSLRDKNKGLTVTDNKGSEGLSGTLQRAAKPSTAIAKPNNQALDAVLKAAAKNSGTVGTGRIGFVIDATGSRSASWKEAQKIQAGMFDSVAQFGVMTLRLTHFGGNMTQDHGWNKDSKTVTAKMSTVECEWGSTQILECLRKFLDDKPEAQAQSIVVIGDSFEEDSSEIAPLTALLKARKIKVFTFLEEGYSSAEPAFRQLAEQTGGVFAAFGSDMPLKDLCEGVAMMSTGGINALQKLQSGAAKTLLLGVKPS